jgi:hypothetical protein
MRPYLIYILIAVLVFLLSCRDSDIETVTTLSPPVSGQETIVHTSAEGGEWPFTYTHKIGSTPKDVYFVLTNPTYSPDYSNIEIEANTYNYSANQQQAISTINKMPPGIIEALDLPINTIPDHIREFNNNPPPMLPLDNDPNRILLNLAEMPPPQMATVGATGNFNESVNTNSVASTCRASRDLSGDINVNIWIANDDFTGSSCGGSCMTTAMAEAFLDKFLLDGTSDVYGWMTNMIGKPWGNHSYDNLIAASSQNTIDILFYDIPTVSGGTIIGYFHAKDNYKVTTESTSNERLIFYMDSVLASSASGGDGWHITDDNPSLIISTLSHEFQHMINFYQKPVLRTGGTASETWLNEMSSLMSEDLMSKKLEVNGPRGVTYSDDTAGSSGNSDTSGRLPTYIYYNDKSIVSWNASYGYSVTYALGAYLLRNFGGATFLKNLVQSKYTNTDAIDEALSKSGYNFSFSDILQRWGVSVLLSDQLDTSQHYRYNTGQSFDSTIDSIGYQIGSINMYHYTLAGQVGPKTISISEVPYLDYHNAVSNIFIKAGSQLSGTHEWRIKMGQDTKLSVVLK